MANLTLFVFCAGSLGLLLVAGLVVIVWRYLSYRETLALAEKGLARPEKPSDGKGALRAGIIVAAIGLALTCGLWPLGLTGAGNRFPLGLGPWMLAGFLPLFFGLALILIHFLTGKDQAPAGTPPANPEPDESNPQL